MIALSRRRPMRQIVPSTADAWQDVDGDGDNVHRETVVKEHSVDLRQGPKAKVLAHGQDFCFWAGRDSVITAGDA